MHRGRARGARRVLDTSSSLPPSSRSHSVQPPPTSGCSAFLRPRCAPPSVPPPPTSGRPAPLAALHRPLSPLSFLHLLYPILPPLSPFPTSIPLGPPSLPVPLHPLSPQAQSCDGVQNSHTGVVRGRKACREGMCTESLGCSVSPRSLSPLKGRGHIWGIHL